MRKHVLLYGLVGGALAAVIKFIEYRWLLVEYSIEIYAALVAAIFAGFGIWLGLRIAGRREKIVVCEVMVRAPADFVRDEGKLAALGITPRELEILALIAGGLSNKEIATKLFVSENTVKTHSSRADPSVIGNAQAQCCRWTFSIADCEWNKICRNTKFPLK